MSLLLLLISVTSVFAYTETRLNEPVLSPDIVAKVNNDPKSTWTAHMSPHFADKTLGHAVQLCGVKEGGKQLPRKNIKIAANIPDEFDPREQWPNCKSLKEVRDQGPCGSCWAISSASVMTDRYCIFSKGEENYHLSTMDIMSCCGFWCGSGCDGGFPAGAFDYWQNNGVVTGGPYNSGEGCYPYELMSCEHHVKGDLPPCPDSKPTPACHKTCLNGLDWKQDKHYAQSSYSVSSNEKEIQTELMQNGPVGAAFTVYEDFFTYQRGVYQHTTGGFAGGHAVKLMGWGTYNDIPYWLVANSWNEDWGDGGYFKILRGSNHCGIESQLVAGEPAKV